VHGAAADTANDVRNILALCRSCHDETEHGQTWDLTEAIGWRVPKFVTEPAEIPALLHTANGYAWQFLTLDVGYLWMDPNSPTPLTQAAWLHLPEDPLVQAGSPGLVSAKALRLTYDASASSASA
jgi:hypothetical protein